MISSINAKITLHKVLLTLPVEDLHPRSAKDLGHLPYSSQSLLEGEAGPMPVDLIKCP